jgi:hypothetical protein
MNLDHHHLVDSSEQGESILLGEYVPELEEHVSNADTVSPQNPQILSILEMCGMANMKY